MPLIAAPLMALTSGIIFYFLAKWLFPQQRLSLLHSLGVSFVATLFVTGPLYLLDFSIKQDRIKCEAAGGKIIMSYQQNRICVKRDYKSNLNENIIKVN